MREAVRMILTLLVVTVLAGVALAGVNGVTAPIVAEMEARALQEGLAEVLPGAAIFEEVPADELARAGGPVQAAWRGVDAEGEPVGVVVQAAPSGYGGAIVLLVGVEPGGTVHQLKVLSATGETPGLGSKATEPAFLQQFLGLSPSIELVKNQPPAGNEIQAVTGATISSRAVLDGVNAALDAARQLQTGR
ncbi:RnfABCDGE type electron transport complex subunit G [Symbiobacterium thermophilum]|uniref:Ion-translocating oxidoreductase complex subunit G n=1 Tax=Symbiobacterium thermophilum TaxID=2734 RepID=A0A953I848_SYMTR|nr:RnfABCDGE type electron transport complex subunit G [Symbiobacterium thermophilum]MBY6276108.1 electron transporter RnfG [Symbiobacterium thermophilum]